ncbi:MAG: endonuclease/exonuclease/phosphatase family protein [Myxococcales bacterium]|nr:endonuclease/exonuclease/phosphatase family protein [Myxococcales bacterium]
MESYLGRLSLGFACLCVCLGMMLGCQTPVEPIVGEFSVLTYNVKGLPAIVEGTEDPATRMKLISPMLNDFDIVGIQENFQYNDELMSKVTLPTKAQANREPRDRAYASGLTLLSKFTAVSQEDAAWEKCFGIASNASDCLAYKGFLRVRLQLQQEPPITLDIYTLHMDAGSGAEDQDARSAQVVQLLAAIKKASGDLPYLVIGDTNMRIKEPRSSGKTDEEQLKSLVEGGGMTNTCVLFDCDKDAQKEHIDRVLFRNSADLKLEALSWKEEGRFVNEKGEPLSDHPAVHVRFRYTYTPPQK